MLDEFDLVNEDDAVMESSGVGRVFFHVVVCASLCASSVVFVFPRCGKGFFFHSGWWWFPRMHVEGNVPCDWYRTV